MTAGAKDFIFEQGVTWNPTLTWYLDDAQTQPVNLTGYTARMHIRTSLAATDPVVTATTANGKIVLGGVAGTIAITLTATDTEALTRDGVYDLELVSGGGVVTRLLEGKALVRVGVTR